VQLGSARGFAPRTISQAKLPLYLGFFAFVHNARRRGKALLGELVAALLT
jgi:transposase